jgi:hypothetical protein
MAAKRLPSRLKKILVGRLNRRSHLLFVDNMNNKIMKLTTIALASGFTLFGTFALANTDHHQSVVGNHRGTVSMAHLHQNVGNPDGPTAFSGAGKDYAVPGWTDEQTEYWIDNATGPKD